MRTFEAPAAYMLRSDDGAPLDPEFDAILSPEETAKHHWRQMFHHTRSRMLFVNTMIHWCNNMSTNHNETCRLVSVREHLSNNFPMAVIEEEFLDFDS